MAFIGYGLYHHNYIAAGMQRKIVTVTGTTIEKKKTAGIETKQKQLVNRE